MLRFNEATLKYVGTVKASNGSPQEVSITRTIKVEEVKNFSLNYYMMSGDNQRLMRLSKNLVVPKWNTEDIVVDGVTYELMYVTYNNKEYIVKEILRQFRTSTKVLLDIEEMR